jgi:excisionase family DNA binding protein
MIELMKKDKVAQLLQISVRQVDYLCQARELTYVKIKRSVRFRAEDVEDFLKKRLTVSTEKKKP